MITAARYSYRNARQALRRARQAKEDGAGQVLLTCLSDAFWHRDRARKLKRHAEARTVGQSVTAHPITGEQPCRAAMQIMSGCDVPVAELVETAVIHWFVRLTGAHHEGAWSAYKLSNGGAFVMPAGTGPYPVQVAGNYFDGRLSPEATGIVVCLFALGEMAQVTVDQECGDQICDAYHFLREYALDHVDASLIFAAID